MMFYLFLALLSIHSWLRYQHLEIMYSELRYFTVSKCSKILLVYVHLGQKYWFHWGFQINLHTSG